MSDVDRLYDLLPAVYRGRDETHGEPLRALLQVVGEQVEVVERDIQALYLNWFIETCEPWVVPYIGDLVGFRPARPLGRAASGDEDQARRHVGAVFPRAAVAGAIALRRRKGTLGALEQLARDVAGWPARAVESYTLLGAAQNVKTPRTTRARSVDVRNMDALERLVGAFDETARSVAVGRLGSRRTRSRWNVPEVALFVFRLRSHSLTRAPAFCIDRASNRYTFSVLGNDAPLMTRPASKAQPGRTDFESLVPGFITRRALHSRTAELYGPGRSIRIWRDGVDTPIPARQMVAADLSEWAYRPKHDEVAVDPERGRIAFSPRNAPETGVWVTWHQGFPDDLGGGEYWRPLSPTGNRARYTVGRHPRDDQEADFQNISEALVAWQRDRSDHPAKADALIEILDGEDYQEQLEIELQPGDRLELRAAQGVRPVLRLLDYYTNRPDQLRIRGPHEPQAPRHGDEPAYADERARLDSVDLPAQRAAGDEAKQRGKSDEALAGPTAAEELEADGEEKLGGGDHDGGDGAGVADPPCPPAAPSMTIDGVLVTGRSVHVTGDVAEVVIRHATLVPGWALDHDCRPLHEEEPSLELVDTPARVRIERSIVGSILVNQSEVATDPIEVSLSDTVLDATGPELDAVSDPDGNHAFARLRLAGCTIFGRVLAHAVELGENSIFADELRVARRQRGCLRYCYVPPGSRTPRRHRCQPDDALAAARERARSERLDEGEVEVRLAREERRVRPQFDSRRYGTPVYARLASTCPAEIGEGADDAAEMGVYHDLFHPQRRESLGAALDEFTPAGMSAGIIFAT
jgi:hypothetical protein